MGGGRRLPLILVDINLLVYAANADSPHHEAARAWLDERLDSPMRVGLPWASLLGFLRLVTSPRVLSRPVGMADAWSIVAGWLGSRSAWIPAPTTRHADVLAGLFARTSVNGNLVPDAHLAALAIEHGLELNSADGDFARFEGLRWRNPLKPDRPRHPRA